MPTRRLGPAALAALAMAMAVIVGTIVPATPAVAASSQELRLLDLTNQVRASVGAPPLVLDEGISVVSRAWAVKMAAEGAISHNLSVGSQLAGWSNIGENVGMGGGLDAVHIALVASPGHYQNIVNPVYTKVGIGVIEVGGGAVYVVESFMRPKGTGAPGAAGAAPAAAPPTTARRAPAATAPVRPTTARQVPAPAARAQGASAPAPVAAAPPAPLRPQSPSPALTFVFEGLRAIDLTFRH